MRKAIAALVISAMAAAGPCPAGDGRRGADAAERAAVSKPEHLGSALAGVWRWGSWRIVAAEDALNCSGPGAEWCPFALIGDDGVIRIEGTALERPWTENGKLVWIRPDGRRMTAAPAAE